MGLRITLVKRVEDTPLFDALFESFWGGAAPVARNPPVVPPDADEESERPLSGLPRRRSVQAWQELEELSVPSPSSREALGRQDFESFGEEELRAVTALARRIARRLSARPGRRWKLSRRGEQVSLRRTLREALKTGGELSTLTYRRRKLRRTRLVVLADVSGSMDLYARLLLQFLYALQNAFSRVETFVFATRLSRVTHELRAPGYRDALGNLSDRVQDWSGGTRIGESLSTFLAGWPRLVDRRTVVVVLSDGWETGDPDVLGERARAPASAGGSTRLAEPAPRQPRVRAADAGDAGGAAAPRRLRPGERPREPRAARATPEPLSRVAGARSRRRKSVGEVGFLHRPGAGGVGISEEEQLPRPMLRARP